MGRVPGGVELGLGGGGWSLDEPFAPSLGWSHLGLESDRTVLRFKSHQLDDPGNISKSS